MKNWDKCKKDDFTDVLSKMVNLRENHYGKTTYTLEMDNLHIRLLKIIHPLDRITATYNGWWIDVFHDLPILITYIEDSYE